MQAATAKKKNLFDENFLCKFLYVEDYYFHREQVISELKGKNYRDIIAPESLEECVSVLKTGRFSHAMLDYNLDYWVGRNNENAIKPNGVECYNGTQLAQFLRGVSHNTQIVLFSSNQNELRRSYENLTDKSRIEVLSHTNDLIEKIIGSVEESHKLELTVKPLHKMVDELPNEIQVFYAKKIINSLRTREDFWKAGRYSWLVGVNQDVSSHYDEIDLCDEYTLNNPEEKFLLNIDKDGLDLELIFDKSTGKEIHFGSVLKDSLNNKPSSLIHKYFITQAICKEYISKQFPINKVIKRLNILGEYSMFESQKILFKELSQNANIQTSCKEDIYELLRGFCSSGFPKILDIYKCRVDSIEDGIAYVKLESFSPENVVRVETFSSEFLSNHHIVGNSRFEYTIYMPAIGGGSAYHIEPI